MKKDKQASLEKHIAEITAPIFAKTLEVPQEDLLRSMTPPKNLLKKAWRPNNYRRQLQVKDRGGSTSTGNEGTPLIFPMELLKRKYKATYYPQNKLINVTYDQDITLQYGRKTLTAIYKQRRINKKKLVYVIESNSTKAIQQFIDQKKKEITERLDQALFKFGREFNLLIPFEMPLWSRYEDFIAGDEFIDSLPEELIIHSTHFKKVYGKGIEFINSKQKDEPTLKTEKYIENRAIEDIAPSIAKAIKEVYDKFGSFITGMTPVLQQINNQNTELLKVRKDILRLERKFNEDLNRKKKVKERSLDNWK